MSKPRRIKRRKDRRKAKADTHTAVAQASLASAGHLGTTFTITVTPPTFKEPAYMTEPRTVSYPRRIDGDSRRRAECWELATVTETVEPWRESTNDDYIPTDEETGVHVPTVWTFDLVRAWLKEAMETLRLCRGERPAGARSGMPDVVREAIEAYGWDGLEVRRRPTAAELTRLDIVLPWLFTIEDRDERIAVVGVAMVLNLRAIGRVIGCSHEQARRLERRAVEELVARLNSGR